MAKRVFVAATGQNCGKTTTSLLLMRAAQKHFGRVGFIKPVGQEYREVDGLIVDNDALLMADVFGLRPWLKHMSPVVADRHFTRRCLDGEVRKEELSERVLANFRVLDEAFDALVIEGTGHSGVGSVFGLNNAFVAKLLGAPVAMVTGGGIGQVIDLVELALPLYRREGAVLSTVIANKLLSSKRDQSLSYLRRAFEPQGINVLGGLNFSPKLANPTLKSIARYLKLELHGSDADSARLVGGIHLGIASAQRVVDCCRPIRSS